MSVVVVRPSDKNGCIPQTISLIDMRIISLHSDKNTTKLVSVRCNKIWNDNDHTLLNDNGD